MNKTAPFTHMVIVDYVNSYDGLEVYKYHNESDALAKFESVIDHVADVYIVEIKRESPYISRRVAGSVDQ